MQSVSCRCSIKVQRIQCDLEVGISLGAQPRNSVRAVKAEIRGRLMGPPSLIELAPRGRWHRAVSRPANTQSSEHGLYTNVVRIVLGRCRSVGIRLIEKYADEKPGARRVLHMMQ